MTILAADWDPAKHPRDDHGRFGHGHGGGRDTGLEDAAAPLQHVTADNPGDWKEDYVADAGGWVPPLTPAHGVKALTSRGRPDGTGTPDDPIDVQGDVGKALDLMRQGKNVRLNQVNEVATLMSKVEALSKKSARPGSKPPDWDFGLLTVRGTNLFTAENKGLPRIAMPQLNGLAKAGTPAARKAGGAGKFTDLTPEFVAQLGKDGITVKDVRQPAAHLRATQTQLVGSKVVGIAAAIHRGDPKATAMIKEPLFVTRDNYVIDGHHRWAAMMLLDALNGKLGDESTMNTRQINMDIGAAIPYTNAWTTRMGIPPQAAKGGGSPVVQAKGMGAKGKGPFLARENHPDCPPDRPHATIDGHGEAVVCHVKPREAQDLAIQLNYPDVDMTGDPGGVEVGAAGWRPELHPRDPHGQFTGLDEGRHTGPGSLEHIRGIHQLADDIDTLAATNGTGRSETSVALRNVARMVGERQPGPAKTHMADAQSAARREKLSAGVKARIQAVAASLDKVPAGTYPEPGFGMREKDPGAPRSLRPEQPAGPGYYPQRVKHAAAPKPPHAVVEHHAACPAHAPHGVVNADGHLLACKTTPAEAHDIALKLDVSDGTGWDTPGSSGAPAASGPDGFDPAAVARLVGAASKTGDGGHPGAAERLRHYWTHGEGALKIRWGLPGDFDRCVNELGKYLASPKGYCAERHHDALGIWPATHAKLDRGGHPDVTPKGAADVSADWQPGKHPRDEHGRFIGEDLPGGHHGGHTHPGGHTTAGRQVTSPETEKAVAAAVAAAKAEVGKATADLDAKHQAELNDVLDAVHRAHTELTSAEQSEREAEQTAQEAAEQKKRIQRLIHHVIALATVAVLTFISVHTDAGPIMDVLSATGPLFLQEAADVIRKV